ncbi:MAG: hypothetical protein RL655_1875, partial [Pseudomonadota bacterium]
MGMDDPPGNGHVLGGGGVSGHGANGGHLASTPHPHCHPPSPGRSECDLIARTALERLTATLKQPVVLDNRAGAGGNIGAQEVARSAPDGYTWMLGTDTIVTVNPHVYRNMPF